MRNDRPLLALLFFLLAALLALLFLLETERSNGGSAMQKARILPTVGWFAPFDE